MKKICFIILFAVLGVTLASCTKETLSDTCVVTVEPSVTYFVNGQMHSANPQTEEEWSMFFDRMLALAQEGYQVRIRRSDIPQEVLAAKEKVTYTTTDFNKAKAVSQSVVPLSRPACMCTPWWWTDKLLTANA